MLSKTVKQAAIVVMAVFFIQMIALPSAHSSTEPDVHIRYYDVNGSTQTALFNSLKNKGPKGYHAYTTWFVQWRYQYRKKNNTCYLQSVEVSKTINILFPKWVDEPMIVTPLKIEWHRYIKALMTHELGHAAFAEKTQRAIKDMLITHQPSTTCIELGETADSNAYRRLHQFQDEETTYDTKTRHGRTQGATFNPVSE